MEDFDRRSFIKIGSLAAFRWITSGDVLQQRAAGETRRGNDISVIHLFLTGGMSQMDTFDPKPNSKPEFRSKLSRSPPAFRAHVTEHLPRCAKLADKYTIVRHDDAQDSGPCTGVRSDSKWPSAASEHHPSLSRFCR